MLRHVLAGLLALACTGCGPTDKAVSDLLEQHYVDVTDGRAVDNGGGWQTYERPYQTTRTEYWQVKQRGDTVHLRMGYDRVYEGAYTRKEKQASDADAKRVIETYVAERIGNGWKRAQG